MDVNIKALDNLTSAAKEFLQKVITPPLEELGLLVADQVKLYRFKNQVAILNKAEAFLKEKGVKTRKVSLKILTPLLEESSLEEEETLQNKWAALLANTVAENSKLDTTLYSHVLSQLTQKDAELFEIVYKLSTTKHTSKPDDIGKFSVTVKQNRIINLKEVKKQRQDAELSIDNLLRLRLIKEPPPGQTNDIEMNIFMLTDLGFRFMAAITID
jgi:hypothetical protein